MRAIITPVLWRWTVYSWSEGARRAICKVGNLCWTEGWWVRGWRWSWAGDSGFPQLEVVGSLYQRIHMGHGNMLLRDCEKRGVQWHRCVCPDGGSLRGGRQRIRLRTVRRGQVCVVCWGVVCGADYCSLWHWRHKSLHDLSHSLHDLTKVSNFPSKGAYLQRQSQYI